jgi:hypothetical protein
MLAQNAEGARAIEKEVNRMINFIWNETLRSSVTAKANMAAH